jgi:hypothetical protein
MTAEEYQQLLDRIESHYQSTVSTAQRAIDRADVRRKEQLAAIQTTWRLLHDSEPPNAGGRRIAPRKPQHAANGDAPRSQRRRIRAIIDALTGSVDSTVVRQQYSEMYPDDAQLDSSTVMKIIRELVAEDWLRLTSKAGFQTPATFEKTANYGREN